MEVSEGGMYGVRGRRCEVETQCRSQVSVTMGRPRAMEWRSLEVLVGGPGRMLGGGELDFRL